MGAASLRRVAASKVLIPRRAFLAAAVGACVVQTPCGAVIGPWREGVGAVGAYHGHVEVASAVVLPRIGTVWTRGDWAEAARIACAVVIHAEIRSGGREFGGGEDR